MLTAILTENLLKTNPISPIRKLRPREAKGLAVSRDTGSWPAFLLRRLQSRVCRGVRSLETSTAWHRFTVGPNWKIIRKETS